MTLILKVMHSADLSPVDSDNPHSLYGDLNSCSFHRQEDGAFARVWQRDAVKTAAVPGFCEHERIIALTGPAYLMNEAGKTVSSFTPKTSGAGIGRQARAAEANQAKPAASTQAI